MAKAELNINIQRNLSFNQNFFKNAVRKTNVTSKQIFQQIRKEELNVSPQDLGSVARRGSIQSNNSKSPQQRFIDMFV